MDTLINLLPFDGEVYFYGKVLSASRSQYFLHKLRTDIQWRQDEAKIFGKHFITKRKVAWYGDEKYDYSYSGATRNALTWTNELLELKTVVENISSSRYNSCLLNLYHDGDEGMAWHSDDEKALGKDSAIASLSFGAERRFLLRHRKSKETIELTLPAGSLLVMQGSTQSHWIHSLPKSKKIKEARVNLTFRMMMKQK